MYDFGDPYTTEDSDEIDAILEQELGSAQDEEGEE